MYGTRCLGVVADGCGELLAAVVEDSDSAHWVAELRAVREDGMGTSTVFYFPNVDPPKDESCDDEEEPCDDDEEE